MYRRLTQESSPKGLVKLLLDLLATDGFVPQDIPPADEGKKPTKNHSGAFFLLDRFTPFRNGGASEIVDCFAGSQLDLFDQRSSD